jgi:hypothetical protein
MEVEVLSEVLQCILTATHQQDIPLRSRPRLQVREAAYVLKKVVEDYVVRRNGRDGADWPLRVVFSVIHFIWLCLIPSITPSGHTHHYDSSVLIDSAG